MYVAHAKNGNRPLVPFVALRDDTRDWYCKLARAALASAIQEAVKPCPICEEIVEIDDERIRQEHAGFIDTPGGFEHMGDVWNQISKWADLIRARGAGQKGEGNG
jgi:hypothetical protein